MHKTAMNKILSRRAVLGGIAASPLAGATARSVAAHQAKIKALTEPISGQLDMLTETASSSGNKTFTDFAKWFTDIGRDQIWKGTRIVRGLDPDIIEMRLPLNTKVRMQRDRNYKKLLAEKRDWFAEVLKSEGKVTWWG